MPIDGVVEGPPTSAVFLDSFIDWLETRGWQFGGQVGEAEPAPVAPPAGCCEHAEADHRHATIGDYSGPMCLECFERDEEPSLHAFAPAPVAVVLGDADEWECANCEEDMTGEPRWPWKPARGAPINLCALCWANVFEDAWTVLTAAAAVADAPYGLEREGGLAALRRAVAVWNREEGVTREQAIAAFPPPAPVRDEDEAFARRIALQDISVHSVVHAVSDVTQCGTCAAALDAFQRAIEHGLQESLDQALEMAGHVGEDLLAAEAERDRLSTRVVLFEDAAEALLNAWDNAGLPDDIQALRELMTVRAAALAESGDEAAQ